MNPLLYGHSNEERIVAVQQKDDRTMREYVRTTDGVRFTDVPFFPFFFLSRKNLIEGFPEHFWLKQLDGANHFSFLCVFQDWRTMWEGVRHILNKHNLLNKSDRVDHYKNLRELFLYADPVTQFLLQTGKTPFKGMKFDDLHRLQLDIETYTSGHYRFSNASREGDEVIIIALSDNTGWSHLLHRNEMSEKELLQALVRIIHERDPDVIEGHNILNFDLPYLLKRAELHKVPLTLGRDNTVPKVFDRPGADGDRAFEFSLIDIAGRHIIDTLHLVQEYDGIKRNMESHGLKYAARYFGFSSPDRHYVPGEKISWYWDNDPETLLRYAHDDVDETGKLSNLLLRSSFFVTQMLPMNLGTAVRMGSASKIENLLVREYLNRKQSIPRPTEGMQTTGGYTDIFMSGLLSPVLHADVESLYPSIMLHKGIRPASDTLDVFTSLLRDLTRIRLDAKQQAKTSPPGDERERLEALQGAMKILINSFYGYLGYSFGLFNDFAQADVVTTTGQQLLRQMMENIRQAGGTVIEVDTDGVFFVPPSTIQGEKAEEKFVKQLSDTLPGGITIALSGRYKKMLSYKMKNYALQSYDGAVTFKGSSLVSRSMEPFGRKYVQECIRKIMDEDIDGLHKVYLAYRERFLSHSIDAKEFARTERLRNGLTEYQEEVASGRRNKSAAYELAIASGRPFKRGDRIRYYIIGTVADVKSFENCKEAEEWNPTFPDENVEYYLRRLDEISSKFIPFFSARDFREVFSAEDLFPLDPSGIQVVTRPIEREETQELLEEEPE